MTDVFTSSYKDPEVQCLITSFVGSLGVNRAIEIGTQQGMSAILIGEALPKGGKLYTYDLFTDTYKAPPYSPTHASKDIAIKNIEEAGLSSKIEVFTGSYQEAFEDQIDIMGAGYSPIDLLHVDICNHYENLAPILRKLAFFVDKGIILEGGIENKWQREHGYLPYNPMIFNADFMANWDHITIQLNDHNAVTLCTRKQL